MTKRGFAAGLLVLLVLLPASFAFSEVPLPPAEKPGDLGGTGGDFSAAAAAPSCSDGAKNQDEVDVDCGGACQRCALGKSCISGANCVSGFCNADKVCAQRATTSSSSSSSSSSTASAGQPADSKKSSSQKALSESDVRKIIESYPIASKEDVRQAGLTEADVKKIIEAYGFASKRELEKPSPSGSFLKFSVFVVFVLVVALGGVVFQSRNEIKGLKAPQLRLESVVAGADPLRDYVKGCIAQGASEDEVRQALLSGGWDAAHIEDAFRK